MMPDDWNPPLVPPTVALAYATRAGSMSPCAKSKRGVVIFYQKVINAEPSVTIIGTGSFNGPPGDLRCGGDEACRMRCRRYCIHAEMRALDSLHAFRGAERATLQGRPPDRDIELLHIKVVDGKAVPGGPPSCLPCASAILDARVDAVWLFEETPQGAEWRVYDAQAFYDESTRNAKR